jgi:hypothetical protein
MHVELPCVCMIDRLMIPAALPAPVCTSNADSAGGGGAGRRLLSEEHEQARRMVLDFHETRRSLQDFTRLTSLLTTLNIGPLPATPKADNPVVIGKSTDNKVRVHLHGCAECVRACVDDSVDTIYRECGSACAGGMW